MAEFGNKTGGDEIENLQLRVAALEKQLNAVGSSSLLTLDRGEITNVPAPVEGQVMIRSLDDTAWYYANGVWRPFGDTMLVANLTFRWPDQSTDNPALVVNRPVTLVWYIVDSSALTVNIHPHFFDDSGGDTFNERMALPGPAGLGANTMAPMTFVDGITMTVLDDAGSAIDPSAWTWTGVTIGMFDPTL